jgi:hypothetical protein
VNDIRRTVWAIPEGFIPSQSITLVRDLVSHETVCLLNTGCEAADVVITRRLNCKHRGAGPQQHLMKHEFEDGRVVGHVVARSQA